MLQKIAEQNYRAAELYKPLNVLNGPLIAQYMRLNVESISVFRARKNLEI